MNSSKIPVLWIALAFFAIYFVWGTTYLANVYVLQGMDPFVGSAIRYLVAGVILLTYVSIRTGFVYNTANIRVSAISGILMLVGGSGLVVFAEKYITSGHAAVLIATEPIWFIILDKKNWRTYFSNVSILAGILIGFVGIMLFMHFTPEGAGPLVLQKDKLKGSIIVLVASVIWVIGTLYGKKRLNGTISNLQTTSLQLIFAGIASALIAIPNGGWHSFDAPAITFSGWFGLAYLIVFGSLIAYLSFTWLVTVRPPAIVSTHTYINPVVAMFAGWLIASEKINTPQILCLLLILAGVFLVTYRKSEQAA
ncbi:EamA family transporter [Pedobacter sp. HMF7647]|uniref:EamA family transporter n=1 Tax=Hufsiella arboris TaxID=2695275 RepID=A0A7K1YBS5_9SPHI|nr:EamA family transporter [Hufsiella arboris]MXV51488.1 EamA family transporter [Hufsiella arboris]